MTAPRLLKGLTLSLLVAIPFSVLPTFAAAPIKAGSACSKAGNTKIYQGKKFTCIKSGKKLVWNKGVPTKSAFPATSPSSSSATDLAPSPAASPNPVSALSSDLRITASGALTNLEVCKTTDQTPDYAPVNQSFMRNGFPRPKGAIYEAKSAKVLFIPMSFSDYPFLKTSQNALRPLSDLDLATKAMKAVEEGFKELSAGRFQVKVDMLPESAWWRFNSTNPIVGGWGVNNFPKIVKLVEEEKSQFLFNDYDAYMFLTSHSSGSSSAQANFSQSLKNSKSGVANLALMSGDLVSHNTFIHEFGHALFAFEDLYLFSTAGQPPLREDLSTPDSWDLMAGNQLQLLNWNRFLMGWLQDSEVRCIKDQKSTTHFLIPFSNDPGAKLTLINLADGVTLAAEARDFGDEKRLLVYFIDTNIPHGQGPIKTFNTLLAKGKTRSIYGWDITVIDNDSKGVLFEVAKTDIDKYVAPEKPKQGPSIGQPDHPISLTGGDITRKGPTKAEIRWNPSNYQSYRIYVTATDNFQKVYFESNFKDSTANPLVVELSGLTCDVDLRVMSMFFTGKQGQGESRVEEITLKRTSC